MKSSPMVYLKYLEQIWLNNISLFGPKRVEEKIMRKTKRVSPELTRRSFLAATAGAVAAGSLAGCASGNTVGEEGESVSLAGTAPQVAEEVYFSSCMGNCSGWGCPINVTVREGKAANLTRPDMKLPDGSPSPYQRICLKGYTNIERMYADTRLQHPLKRKGERGAGEWERISWDEAIAEITDTWKNLQGDFGPGAVGFLAGSGNVDSTVKTYADRLIACMGATVLHNCYDNTGVYCQYNHGALGATTTGGHNEYRDIVNAENIFVWGSNPSESFIVDYHFISEACEAGAKLVVIDPIFTTTAAKADLYVSIRPGTDGLLAAGIAQIAIRDGKIDVEHMRTKTVAPFLVKEDGFYLRLSDLGRAEAGSDQDRIMVYDGVQLAPFDEVEEPVLEGSFELEGFKVRPAYQILVDRFSAWTLDQISQYTDIPLDVIEEVASIYLSGRSMVLLGFGQDHYANGQTFYDGVFALADITGQECKHGAGSTCVDLTGAVAQGVQSTAGMNLDGAVAGPTVYVNHLPQLVEEGSIGEFDTAPRSMYIYYCNPLANMPDRQRWLSMLDKMDLVVVSDMVMSETAEYADIVLPVAFPFEKSDLTFRQTGFVKLIDQAVETPFEVKSDFDVITLLGRAMGFEQYFTQTLEDFLSSCVDNEVAQEAGVTWDKLQSEHAVWSHPEEPSVIGLNAPILTATGRLEFYHEGIKPMMDVGQEWDMLKESCWFWEPPLEAWHENPLFERYPLTFISERCKYKTHTIFNNVPALLEIDPEPFVKMSPSDAASRDINTGDIVRLYNDRGHVVLKAVVSNGCRKGVLVIDHGWEERNFIEGHYGDLSSIASWPRFEQDNWFDCLCEMEKVQ